MKVRLLSKHLHRPLRHTLFRKNTIRIKDLFRNRKNVSKQDKSYHSLYLMVVIDVS
jgi:hypothetical protein